MGSEILILVVLISINAVLAIAEIALAVARKSRLQDWADRGSAMARRALELVDAPQRFLYVAQVGITLMGIVVGAFGSSAVADRVAAYVSLIPELEPYSAPLSLGLVMVGLCYFFLVFGELVPKRLAAIDPERVLVILALPLRLMTKISAPVIYLLNLSTETVFRLFGAGPHREHLVTEEEIKTLVQKGTEAGVFEETEQDMVEAVLRLGDKTARALMTPRTQIVWFDVEDSPEAIRKKVTESGHSRFPVSNGKLDNVVGVAQAKDLLTGTLAGAPIKLATYLQQATFVPRTMSALQVLEFIKRSGSHIALVVDEYGGIEGLLTHHDILEAIAGDIPFGPSPTEPKAVQRHDGSWLLDGMLSIDEFKEIFNQETLPGEKKDAYQTLGGFLFTQMGRVPSVSDRFEWNGLCFEIVDMDGKRIDKVLVTSVQSDASADDSKPTAVRDSQSGLESQTKT
ncbi:MAG: hemolysin family protein [Candidatus Binatia bacterium]